MKSPKAGSKAKAGSKSRRPPLKTRARKGTNRRPSGPQFMGVTVPKALTNALDSLVNSPRGREILANALIAAASAAAAALIKTSDGRQKAEVRKIAAGAGNQVTDDLSEAAAAVIADLVGSAARSLLPSSLTGTNRKRRADRRE